MNKVVYIVTDGSYSDYHICAVFSNKKDAERYCKLTKSDEVEIWDIDNFDLDKHANELYWQIKFADNGDVISANQYSPDLEDDIEDIYIEGGYSRGTRYYDGLDIRVRLWAKDKESAVKIASERRMILLGSHPEFVELARKDRWGKLIKFKNNDGQWELEA
jgi:hypothetical protein